MNEGIEVGLFGVIEKRRHNTATTTKYVRASFDSEIVERHNQKYINTGKPTITITAAKRKPTRNCSPCRSARCKVAFYLCVLCI